MFDFAIKESLDVLKDLSVGAVAIVVAGLLAGLLGGFFIKKYFANKKSKLKSDSIEKSLDVLRAANDGLLKELRAQDAVNDKRVTRAQEKHDKDRDDWMVMFLKILDESKQHGARCEESLTLSSDIKAQVLRAIEKCKHAK